MKDSGKFKNCEEGQSYSGKVYSRRAFLKVASVAGAAVAAGAGLGGLAASCGGATATTTASAAASTTTTAAASSTSVSASATTGREIKLGFVTPQTGSLASFGGPDKYCTDRATEAYGDGVVCGDGLKHPISIEVRDCQSNSNRAAQVAGDLIANDKVDILLAASTSLVVMPVADQAEANGVPCLSNDCPWTNYVFARGANPKTVFKWTFNVNWGMEDLIATFFDIWNQVPTNKKVGALFPNDALGNSWLPAFKAAAPAGGWTPDIASQYQAGSEDYTSVISQFKKNGDEVLTGAFTASDFSNFWKQCLQGGWRPKVVTPAVALSYPEDMEALGPIGLNICDNISWLPQMPFTSSLLNNETCQAFGDKYGAATTKQPNQSLNHFQLFEWAWDVLQRATNVDDKDAIMDAVRSTKMDTIAGPIDFTAPIEAQIKPGPGLVTANCYKSPVAGAQWRKGTGQWKYDAVIVGNVAAPMVTVEDKVQPIVYTS